MTTTDTPRRCAVCGQIIAYRSTFIPTTLGAMHPSCWESGHKTPAPKPTGGDEDRAREIVYIADHVMRDDAIISVKGIIDSIRAEERAAQATQIAALREALLAVQKAMRPFEWASQYVDHRLVGEPMVKQFTAAVGKLTIGNFNELARATTRVSAALEMSGGVG